MVHFHIEGHIYARFQIGFKAECKQGYSVVFMQGGHKHCQSLVPTSCMK